MFEPVPVVIDAEKNHSTKRKKQKLPVASMVVLGLLVFCCLFAGLFTSKDPAYLDLLQYAQPPSAAYPLGTDTLGRDMLACVLYGGRISMGMGFMATVISTVLGVVYGAVSGMSPAWAEALLMRLIELFLSIPALLWILFIQALWGTATLLSLAVVMGVTSWCSIARMVHTEVKQLRTCQYVLAAKSMGAGFFHIMVRHLLPNLIAPILYMVVMNLRTAILSETTLSYMGMGLPLETVSWGSMLSLGDKALLTGSWWMLVVPGVSLVVLLLCVTHIGNWLRERSRPQKSNL